MMASLFARTLRVNATDAEQKLWAVLRFKQLGGARFRRQQPLGRDIADFFCPSAKLIVELDGDQHGSDDQMARDAARTRWLEAHGYSVLRFANHEVLKDRNRVVEVIVHALERSPHPKRSRATASTSPSRGEVKEHR